MNKNIVFIFTLLINISRITTMDHSKSESPVSSLSSQSCNSVNNSCHYKFEALDPMQQDIQQNYAMYASNINPLNIYNYISLPIKERTETKFYNLTYQERLYVQNYLEKSAHNIAFNEYRQKNYDDYMDRIQELEPQLSLDSTDSKILADLQNKTDQIKNLSCPKKRKEKIDELSNEINNLILDNENDRDLNFHNNHPFNKALYIQKQFNLHAMLSEYISTLATLKNIKECDASNILQTFFSKKIAKKACDHKNNSNYEQTELAKNVSEVLNISDIKHRQKAIMELTAKIKILQNNNNAIIEVEKLYPTVKINPNGSRYYGAWSNNEQEIHKIKSFKRQQAKGACRAHQGDLIKNDLEYKHALSLLSQVTQHDSIVLLQSLARKKIACNTITKLRHTHILQEKLRQKKEQLAVKRMQEEQAAKKLQLQEEQAAEKLRLQEERKQAQRKANQDILAAKKAQEQEEIIKKQKARQEQSARDKAKRDAKLAAEKAKQDADDLALLTITQQATSADQVPVISEEKAIDISQVYCQCTKKERYNAWLHERNEMKQKLEISIREKYTNKPAKGKKLTKNALEETIKAEVIKEFNEMNPYDEKAFRALQAYATQLQPDMSIESFHGLKKLITETQSLLISQGLSITWYLANNLDLYETIKAKYKVIQKNTENIDRIALSKIQEKLIHDSHTNPQIHKGEISQALYQKCKLEETQLIIADQLTKIHRKNGMLDIILLLYPEPTSHMFDDTKKLSRTVLLQAETQIKKALLKIKNNDNLLKGLNPKPRHVPLPLMIQERWNYLLNQPSYYSTITPIIINLLHKAKSNINPSQIKSIIEHSIELGVKGIDNNNIQANLLSVVQADNEFATQPQKQDVLIDIAKIYACALKATIDIVQEV